MARLALWFAGGVLASMALLARGVTAPADPAVALAGQPAPSLAAPRVDPQRSAYFGELHLHTAVSFDAYIMGARVGVDDAYRFGRGDTIQYQGKTLRREEPLDFMAVTDHAEQMGLGDAIEDRDSAFSRSDIGRRLKASIAAGNNPFALVTSLNQGDNGLKAVGQSAWRREVAAANRFYEPGRFTTFIAYEWSSTPKDQNLHRNVIFRGRDAPFPFSSTDSQRPEDLWTYLEANRRRGYPSLAIPHNANASNGLMYDWVDSDRRPISEAYAQRRMLNEPLSEIAQGKGQSETHPLLSPDDEFANFEVFDYLFGPAQQKSRIHGSYVREAYGRGLAIAARTGANPYKFGMAGGSDFHSGLSTSSEQAYGGSTTVPPAGLTALQVRQNLDLAADPQRTIPIAATGSGALTGVWAEANTREAIFDALRRKETFATSGTRIRLRFFAGWNYGDARPGSAGWVKAAYARGVPMGGDLAARPAGGKPHFLIWALKDPNGANLDRAQVIKVWLDGGKPREKLFDVALSGGRAVNHRTGKAPRVGNSVDLHTASFTNSIGATQLAADWVDPAFDPAQPAVYYLRVIEIPTPRWSTILAVRNHLPLPGDMPATLQERAWSSPIWYTPARPAT